MRINKLILLLIGMTHLSAQAVTNSPWHQINTAHFELIFPNNLKREAHRIANTLEHIYRPVGKSLDVRPKPIAIILRNQTTTMNGHFSLMPRRVEFFTFPMQGYGFLHVNDWLTLLAVHELRHVAQFGCLAHQFDKLLYMVGGENMKSAWDSFNIPGWFYEGDAVGIETALTKGGRGRIPYFSLLYKANLLERKALGYQKQVFGSYQDPSANHYVLGYYLTTHLRKHYGAQVLAYIFQATSRPMLFFAAVKEITGKSLLAIHQDANQELKAIWQQQVKDLHLTAVQRLNARKSNPVYTHYSYPQVWEKEIIALKQGMDTPAQFVVIDAQQKEKHLLTLGNINTRAGFSVAQGKIVWIEEVPDLLWEDRSYSVIQLYDSKTKQFKTLTPKSRYGSAALSPDATTIVALESNPSYDHQLVILDAAKGHIRHRIPNPNNYLYLMPRFSADGQYVIAIKQANGKSILSCIQVSTGTTQDILSSATQDLGWPLMTANYVFYNSSYNGIDNIYAMDIKTRQCYQVTSRKYGAYHATIASMQNNVLFNDFSKDGMDIVTMPLAPSQWLPLEKVKDRTIHYYAPLIQQEHNQDLLQHIPHDTYLSKPYPTHAHWLHIHSWTPYCKLNLLGKTPHKNKLGLTLYSCNLLNTASWSAGYIHDFTNKNGQVRSQFIYKGWYPDLKLGGELNKVRNQHNLYMGFDFPLTWVQRQYRHKLHVGITNHIYFHPNHTCCIQAYEARFVRTSPSSLKDIAPPWKQTLETAYKHTLYQSTKQAKLWNIKVGASFPGFFKHHSLRLEAKYQYQTPDFSQIAIKELTHKNHKKKQMHLWDNLLAYVFPIAYPDWDLGLFCYLKRLKNTLFYQWSYVGHQGINQKPDHQIFGTETTFTFYLLSCPLPLEIGIVCCYNSRNGKLGLNTGYQHYSIINLVMRCGNQPKRAPSIA